MAPPLMRGHLLTSLSVIAGLVAGCAQPTLRECTVRCGLDQLCPGSYHATCGADGYCHLEGEEQHGCDQGLADLAGLDLLGVDLGGGGGVDLLGADLFGADLAPSHLSLCATSGLVFCDGFESSTLDPHWDIATMNATVVSGGFRGDHAVRFSLAAGMTSAQLPTHTPFPQLASDLWARSFVNLPASRPGFVVLMEITNATGQEGWLLSASNGSLELDEYGAGAPLVGSTPLPSDRFVCIEWHLGGGELHAYLEGQEVTELAVTGRVLPAWATFLFSSSLPTAGPSLVATLDEVALDSARITCVK